MRIPTKITLSCIWVAIPVDWVILHWYAWVADGRCTVTSLPNFLGLVDYFIFLPMVLRWRDSRESSAITPSQMANQMVTLRIKLHRSRVSDGCDHFTRVCPASFPYFLSMNSLRNLFAALAKKFRTFFLVLFCFVLFFFFFQFVSLFVLLLFSFFFFPLRDVHACKISFFCWRLLACWWNTSAVTMKIKSLKSYFGIMTLLYRFDFW